jgi:hypothetical protein
MALQGQCVRDAQSTQMPRSRCNDERMTGIVARFRGAQAQV